MLKVSYDLSSSTFQRLQNLLRQSTRRGWVLPSKKLPVNDDLGLKDNRQQFDQSGNK